MRDKKELCNEIVNYFKDTNPYEFNNCYDNLEEAFNNFYKMMNKNSKGILSELREEINELIMYNDLRDKEMKKRYETVTRLAYDLNVFYNHSKEKEKEL